MTANNTTSRRAFLAAGAALSVGILGTPVPGLFAATTAPPITERLREGSLGSAGPLVRSLVCEVPMPTTGGPLEIALDENNDPDWYPGTVFLSLHQPSAPGDTALGTVVTPDELDALIAVLTAMRTRAGILGIL